jgi:hypothetical protein
VEPQVVGELRVEGRRHHRAPGGQRPGRSPTEASTSTSGPASSTHGARMKTACSGDLVAVDGEVGLEGVDLAAEGVAAHGDVDAPRLRWSGRPSRTSRASRIIPAQVPRAGRPSARPLAQRLPQPAGVEQLGHRGGLATGEDQRVDAGELGGRADLDRRGAERGQGRRRVRADAPWRARTPTLAPAVLTNPGRRRWSPACRPRGRAWRRPGPGTPWRGSPRRGSAWWPRRWPWPGGPGRRT